MDPTEKIIISLFCLYFLSLRYHYFSRGIREVKVLFNCSQAVFNPIKLNQAELSIIESALNKSQKVFIQ